MFGRHSCARPKLLVSGYLIQQEGTAIDAQSTQRGLAVSELPEHANTDLGHTEWRTMEQERVNSFADVTEDHNPIHVDPATTPFGATVAHGYLTLAMVAPLPTEVSSAFRDGGWGAQTIAQAWSTTVGPSAQSYGYGIELPPLDPGEEAASAE